MTTQDVEVVSEVPLATGHLIPAGQTGLMEIYEARWNFSWVHDGGMLSIQGDNTSLERSTDNESFWCNAKLGNGQVIQLVAQQDANASQSVESVKVESPLQEEEMVDEEAMAEPPSSLGSAERLNLVARAAELRQQGILTDEEFQTEKRRILGISKQPMSSINTGAESVEPSTPVSTTAFTAPPKSTDSLLAMNRDTAPLPVEQATPMPDWLAAKEIVSPSTSSPSRPSESGPKRPDTESPSSAQNPTSKSNTSSTSRASFLCFVGAALVIGGAFLPDYAASVNGESESINAFQIIYFFKPHAIHADGALLCLSGALLLVVGLYLLRTGISRRVLQALLVFSFLLVLPSTIHVWMLRHVTPEGTIGPGIGSFVSDAGALIAIAAVLSLHRSRRMSQQVWESKQRSHWLRATGQRHSSFEESVRSRRAKTIGLLCIAASTLVLLGGFLPLVTVNAVIIQRGFNAFQFGAYGGMDYNGYFLLAGVAVFALTGMEVLGSFAYFKFRRWLVAVGVLFLSIPLINTFGNSGAHFSIGIGAIISIIGGITALSAIMVSFARNQSAA